MVVKKRNVRRVNRRRGWFEKVFKDQDVRLVPRDRHIHGTASDIPLDYFFAKVPPNVQLQTLYRIPKGHGLTLWNWAWSWYRDPPPQPAHLLMNEGPYATIILGFMEMPHNLNILPAVVGLGQLLYGVHTVYKARGNQIDRYGMLAFGLTVVPYAFMSLINTLATFVTPQYPGIYLLCTTDMEAAMGDGAKLGGVIGQIKLDESLGTRVSAAVGLTVPKKVALDPLNNNNNLTTWLYRIMLCLLVVAPILFVLIFANYLLNRETNPIQRIIWILL
jgi:hypothetical protein